MSYKIIEQIPIINNDEVNTLELKVYYNKGGMNYFTGSTEKRGLFFSVVPVNIKDGSKSFTMFSGIKKHVKDMARFNQKQLDTFVPNEEDVKTLIEHVVKKNSLTLGERT